MRVPNLPFEYEAPCPSLPYLSGLDAKNNFEYLVNVSHMYSECSHKKDVVTKAYQKLVK